MSSFSFLKKVINLPTWGCARSSLLHTDFLSLRRAGAALYLRRAGCSLGWRGAAAPGRTGFSSCGTRAQSPCAVWDPPGSGIEPTWPALASWFLTTGQPGKSSANWSSLNSTVSLACPTVWHEAGYCKPFSFGILGIPSRGPWRNTARLLCPEDPFLPGSSPGCDLSAGAQLPIQRSGSVSLIYRKAGIRTLLFLLCKFLRGTKSTFLVF